MSAPISCQPLTTPWHNPPSVICDDDAPRVQVYLNIHPGGMTRLDLRGTDSFG